MAIMKEIIVQLFFTLIPILAIHFSGFNGTASAKQRLWIGAICFVSMAACMRLAFPMHGFYTFDFRLIPYIAGVLYGGLGIGAVITALYVAIRFAMYGGGHPFYAFLLQHAVLIPVVFLCIKPFRRSSPMGRSMWAACLTFFSLVTTELGVWLRSWTTTELKPEFYASMFGLYILMGFVAWLMIYFIEHIVKSRHIVAELKRLSALREQETNKLRSLMDALPLSFISIDTEGIVTAVNNEVLRYWTDKKKEDLLGAHYRIFTDSYGIDYRKSGIYRAIQGHIVKNEVNRYNDVIFLVSAYPIRNVSTGHIEGAVSLAQDITELHNLRTEIGHLGQLKLVGQMAASIAHEVRNPMTVVRGFLQLLSQKPNVPEATKRYYDIALEELDRANDIIGHFLSLAHNRIVPKNDHSLNEIVRELEPLMQAEATLQGVTMVYELDDDVPPIMLNPKEMKQLILNLTRNALEEIGGDGKVTIRTVNRKKFVELHVADNGRGIPEEQLDKIFEPFYTTKDTGTGLGLPACLSIVEQHGGKIRVNSKAGEGTTFIVSFYF